MKSRTLTFALYLISIMLLSCSSQIIAKEKSVTPLTEKEFMSLAQDKLERFTLVLKKYSDTVPKSDNKDSLHLKYENKPEKQEIDLFVLDTANYGDDLDMANMIYEMEASFGKDKKPYVAKMEDNSTNLIYKIKDRLVIFATGLNMNPEELWKYIEKLSAKKLISPSF